MCVCAGVVWFSQVTDIVDFIGAPWASALFHDKFPAFREALVGLVQEVGGGTPQMDAYEAAHTVSEVQDPNPNPNSNPNPNPNPNPPSPSP